MTQAQKSSPRKGAARLLSVLIVVAAIVLAWWYLQRSANNPLSEDAVIGAETAFGLGWSDDDEGQSKPASS